MTVWTHSEPALHEFLGNLNRYHTSIKLGTRGQSHFWTQSPTCRTNALRRSCLSSLLIPINTATSPVAIPDNVTDIPFSQALILCRICSEQQNLGKRTEDLNKQLAWSGYTDQLREPEIQCASSTPRENSLKLRKREKTDQIPLVVTYHPIRPPLGCTTRQHNNIRQALDRLRKAIPLPPIIVFHLPKNFRDLLVRADITLTSPSAPGNKRCTVPR